MIAGMDKTLQTKINAILDRNLPGQATLANTILEEVRIELDAYRDPARGLTEREEKLAGEILTKMEKIAEANLSLSDPAFLASFGQALEFFASAYRILTQGVDVRVLKLLKNSKYGSIGEVASSS